jgi:poly-beta-1,6-N-acetyl-D-glucosamine biosynthesis protein PgaD
MKLLKQFLTVLIWVSWLYSELLRNFIWIIGGPTAMINDVVLKDRETSQTNIAFMQVIAVAYSGTVNDT